MNEIYVVGIGPGKRGGITEEAYEAIDRCQVIVGYTVYVKQLMDWEIRENPGEAGQAAWQEKLVLTTGMREERARCRLAYEKAQEGYSVCVVCSGDAGVYGMAGLMLEMGGEYPRIEVRVVAGVTAALSGAALLGAPLGHDFAVISLSDLLTPWERIADRLRHAAAADLVLCLYNPSSRKRRDYLARACGIVSPYRVADTVCGYVRNIGRDGEEAHVCTLSELSATQVDMFTTVYIGSSATRLVRGRMVTPRGYRDDAERDG